MTTLVNFSSSGMTADEALVLEFSTNGLIWTPIVSKTVSAGGSYKWFVDDLDYPIGKKYLLRIKKEDGTVSSQSGLFTIKEPAVEPQIIIRTPNTVEHISLNSTYDILWSTTGLSASDILVVEYSFDGGFTGWDQLSSGTVADFKGRFR
jgi:hypothetical protein